MVAERRLATVEDLLLTPDDGRTYELIDGEIVVSPAPSPRHQQVSAILSGRLERWVTETNLGLWFAAPADVMLYEGVVVQPDVFYVAHDNPGQWVDTVFHGAPDLVIEILSPSSIGKDTVLKGSRYERSGVREYWIVGETPGSCMGYRSVDGNWQEQPVDADDMIESAVMPGFRINLKTLFELADRRLASRRPR